jgi:hypothetical protein
MGARKAATQGNTQAVDAAFDAMERNHGHVDKRVSKYILKFFNDKAAGALVQAGMMLLGNPVSTLYPPAMPAMRGVSATSLAGMVGNFCSWVMPGSISAAMEAAGKLVAVKQTKAVIAAGRRAADAFSSAIVKTCAAPITAVTNRPGQAAMRLLERTPSRLSVPTGKRLGQIAQAVMTLGLVQSGNAADVKETQTLVVLALVLGPHLNALFTKWNKDIPGNVRQRGLGVKLPDASDMLTALADAPPGVKAAVKALVTPRALQNGKTRFTQQVVRHVLSHADRGERRAIVAVAEHLASKASKPKASKPKVPASINTLNLRMYSKRVERALNRLNSNAQR